MSSKEGDIGRLEEQFGSRFAVYRELGFDQMSVLFVMLTQTIEILLGRFGIPLFRLGVQQKRVFPWSRPRVKYSFVYHADLSIDMGCYGIISDAPLIITNDGAHKTSGPLVSNEVPEQQVGSLIIVDSVLDQGGTLDRTIAACDGRISAEQIVMLTVIAYPPTVERVLKQYPTLNIITADTESNFIPAKVGIGIGWLDLVILVDL